MVGEHIRALKNGRWVHAIDCGDETVLHLVEEATPPRVRRAYRPEFVAGAEAVEHVTHRERTFPAKEIVRRAYSRASDPALAVMFKDSEAFADWCETGRVPAAPRNVVADGPSLAMAPPAPARRSEAPALPRAAQASGATARQARTKRSAKASPKRSTAEKRATPVKARAKPAAARTTRLARKGAERKKLARAKAAPRKASNVGKRKSGRR